MRYFDKQAAAVSPYGLELAATTGAGGWTYLDMAVEFSGFIYVLSSGRVAADGTTSHRLDICHPDQPDGRPIATTLGLNAARLAVDLWRNLYTLNYEVLTVQGRTAPVTEPSVSLWTPAAAVR